MKYTELINENLDDAKELILEKLIENSVVTIMDIEDACKNIYVDIRDDVDHEDDFYNDLIVERNT